MQPLDGVVVTKRMRGGGKTQWVDNLFVHAWHRAILGRLAMDTNSVGFAFGC